MVWINHSYIFLFIFPLNIDCFSHLHELSYPWAFELVTFGVVLPGMWKTQIPKMINFLPALSVDYTCPQF